MLGRPLPPGGKPPPKPNRPVPVSRDQEEPVEEGQGRWNFHPLSELPAPQTFRGVEKIYPSGGSSVKAKPPPKPSKPNGVHRPNGTQEHSEPPSIVSPIKASNPLPKVPKADGPVIPPRNNDAPVLPQRTEHKSPLRDAPITPHRDAPHIPTRDDKPQLPTRDDKPQLPTREDKSHTPRDAPQIPIREVVPVAPPRDDRKPPAKPSTFSKPEQNQDRRAAPPRPKDSAPMNNTTGAAATGARAVLKNNQQNNNGKPPQLPSRGSAPGSTTDNVAPPPRPTTGPPPRPNTSAPKPPSR